MTNWNDDTGESSGYGPSWKWLVTGIVALTVPLIGGMLFWIASNLQNLVEEMPTVNYRIEVTTKQLDDINTQLRAINATLSVEEQARQKDEYDVQSLTARMVRIEDMTSTIPDWVAANKRANRALQEAIAAANRRR